MASGKESNGMVNEYKDNPDDSKKQGTRLVAKYISVRDDKDCPTDRQGFKHDIVKREDHCYLILCFREIFFQKLWKGSWGGSNKTCAVLQKISNNF